MNQSLAELISTCTDTATCTKIRVSKIDGRREGVPQEGRERHRVLASHCGCIEVNELVDVQEHDVVIAVPAAHEALLVHQHLHQEMKLHMKFTACFNPQGRTSCRGVTHTACTLLITATSQPACKLSSVITGSSLITRAPPNFERHESSTDAVMHYATRQGNTRQRLWYPVCCLLHRYTGCSYAVFLASQWVIAYSSLISSQGHVMSVSFMQCP